ncbi:Uncharacterized protein apha_00111 [Umezakia ovalisporum]|nr:Uncharacterized protein apha_00111 [Umezakia ovalisporum]
MLNTLLPTSSPYSAQAINLGSWGLDKCWCWGKTRKDKPCKPEAV